MTSENQNFPICNSVADIDTARRGGHRKVRLTHDFKERTEALQRIQKHGKKLRFRASNASARQTGSRIPLCVQSSGK